MSEEPENLVLALLREMRADIARLDAKIDAKAGDLQAEVHSLGADVASDLLTVEKRLTDQIVGLRHAVMAYHSSTVGHGALISELDERFLQLEKHLKASSNDAH